MFFRELNSFVRELNSFIRELNVLFANEMFYSRIK